MAEPGYVLKDKVSPRGLKTLKQHGLLEFDRKKYTGALLEIYCDNEDDLREICQAVFTDDFSKVSMDDIDLEKVSKGVQDFLLRALGGSLN